MKRLAIILLVLSIFRIGAVFAETTPEDQERGAILVGNSQGDIRDNLIPVAIIGADGLPGPVGATGPQGDVGPIGPTGETGATGPAGAQGIQGEPGVAGPAGAAGPAGPAGPTGPAGPAGPAGTGSGGSSSLGQGTVTVGTCDTSITMAFTSHFSSGTFALDSIIMRDVASACSGKTVNVFFTMDSASSGSFGPYAAGNVLKCTTTIGTIPSGTSATVTIARTDPTCTNTTTSASLGQDLRKIGARDFNETIGVEITDG